MRVIFFVIPMTSMKLNLQQVYYNFHLDRRPSLQSVPTLYVYFCLPVLCIYTLIARLMGSEASLL